MHTVNGMLYCKFHSKFGNDILYVCKHSVINEVWDLL